MKVSLRKSRLHGRRWRAHVQCYGLGHPRDRDALRWSLERAAVAEEALHCITQALRESCHAFTHGAHGSESTEQRGNAKEEGACVRKKLHNLARQDCKAEASIAACSKLGRGFPDCSSRATTSMARPRGWLTLTVLCLLCLLPRRQRNSLLRYRRPRTLLLFLALGAHRHRQRRVQWERHV